jgi:hypothetical protein
MWLADSPEQTVAGVAAYLANPTLHAEARQRMVAMMCGPVDGRAGSRMADAILAVAGAGALQEDVCGVSA